MDYLFKSHQKAAIEATLTGFLGLIDEEEAVRLRLLPKMMGDRLLINTNEWLLADSRLNVGDRIVPAMDLVLGPRGPALDKAQRAYLESLGQRPLSLYRVRDVERGKHFRLDDLLGRKPASVELDDPVLSVEVHEGMVFGGRLVSDPWELSQGLYAILPDDIDGLHQLLTEKDIGDEVEVTTTIIRYWLRSVLDVSRQTMPDLGIDFEDMVH